MKAKAKAKGDSLKREQRAVKVNPTPRGPVRLVNDGTVIRRFTRASLRAAAKVEAKSKRNITMMRRGTGLSAREIYELRPNGKG